MKSECETCQWLLHYEWDEDKKAHSLPRCSIEFRNGNLAQHPCPDKITRGNEPYQSVLPRKDNQEVSSAWRAYAGMRSLATLNCQIALSAARDCVEHAKEARERLDKALEIAEREL